MKPKDVGKELIIYAAMGLERITSGNVMASVRAHPELFVLFGSFFLKSVCPVDLRS